MKRLSLILATVAAGSIAVAAAQSTGPSGSGEPVQQFGWQQSPHQVDPSQIDRPLTELERLSQSRSGVGFGRDNYDPRSDNPLEPVSVTLRALDKITARYTDLVIDINAESRFGTLQIVPRTCDKRPPEEIPEVSAFLEIRATDDFQRLPTSNGEDPLRRDAVADGNDPMAPVSVSETAPGDMRGGMSLEDDDADSTLFRGWMFASSPALNALEHPVYDIWVIDCTMIDPSI